MADDVEVKVGADTGDATSSIKDAANSIASSLAGMKTALENFGASNRKTVSEAVANNADLSRSFLELRASTTSGFNAITGVIERFRGVLATLAAALAGGILFKGAVSSMLGLEDAVRGLTIFFGMSAEAATKQAIALKLAGLNAEQYEMMAQRVGLRIRLQSEEFDRLGVVTKDAAGNFLPMDQILQNIYKRMQDFKVGTDQDLVAMTLVGRNAKDFASDMDRLNAATDRAAVLQKQLGIEMGPERIAQLERYRQDMNAFGIVLDTIGEKIGEAVLPRLEGLAAWFNSVGPRAVEYVVTAVKYFISWLTTMGGIVATTMIYATAQFDKFAANASAAWEIVKAAATGNFAAIPGIVERTMVQVTAINKAAAESVTATWEEAHEKIKRLFEEPSAGGAFDPRLSPGKPGSERFTPKPSGASDISGWEAVLDAARHGYDDLKNQQNSFEVWSEAMTRDYWAEVLEFANLSAKDREAVEHKFNEADRKVKQEAFASYLGNLEDEKAALGHNIEAKIAIAQQEYAAVAQRYGAESKEAEAAYKKIAELRQQLADQRNKIAEVELKASEALSKHEVEMNKIAADQDLALRRISADQRLAIEIDFLNREYAAERAAIVARIALLADDPTSNPVKLAELKANLLVIDANYQKQLTSLDNEAEKERMKDAIAATDAVQSSFATFFDTVTSRTKSLSQAFRDMVSSITNELNKLASNELAKQLFGPGTEAGGALTGLFSKIFGGGGGGAGGAGGLTAAGTTLTTAGTLLQTAATALQSAAATLSGGGGFGALGGGGGAGWTSGFDLAGGGGLAGFESGTPYVPATSLAIVHKGEAIIPAKYNTALGGGFTVHNHFSLSGPVDTRTQDQIAASAAQGVHRASRRVL
jgi:hypothetical protein